MNAGRPPSPVRSRVWLDGRTLDDDEAQANFPDLDEIRSEAVGLPPIGAIACLKADGTRFRVRVCGHSADPGFAFGKILDFLPENDQDLGPDQIIGFVARNVLAWSAG